MKFDKKEYIQVYRTESGVCPICNKDGCLIAADGKSVLCSRVRSVKIIGDVFRGGYLHSVDLELEEIKPTKRINVSCKNWGLLNRVYQLQYKDHTLQREWRVSEKTLLDLGIGECGLCHTFPLRNNHFEIVGIQKRDIKGKKIYCRHSDGNGLFIPDGTYIATRRLIIAEGVSDCAVINNLGYFCIGRSCCNGGIDYLKKIIDQWYFDDIVIIADRDKNEAGIQGAVNLANRIKNAKNIEVKMCPGDYKDVREWSQNTGRFAMDFDVFLDDNKLNYFAIKETK